MNSAFTRLALVIGLGIALGCPQPLAAQTAGIGLELVVGGLESPVDITGAGDGSGRLFIAQQTGQILLYDADQGQLLPSSFLDISDRISAGGERGLLGMAFHPNFATNRRFFLNYTDPNGGTVIARFTVSADPNRANPDPDAILLMIPQPFPNHNGGQLQFGPDGFLYVALGDGGSGGDPGNRAQNLDVLLGKLLRLDVDSADPFAVPGTNPFVANPQARNEIWAYGLRNPWRFSFDRVTGELFIADVGQSAREEVNLQPANSPGGQNYGWRRMEGSLCFNPESNCNDGTLVLPIIEYSHAGGNCSITGGYRYRGARFPVLAGVYFYADFCTGRIWGATQQANGAWASTELLNAPFNITTFGEDDQGELYVADFSGGRVFRLLATNPAPALTSLSIESVTAGESGFSLGLNGSGFVFGSVARWNGVERATTLVSSGQLAITLSSADLATAGTAQVTVVNPTPGGGISNALPFTVNEPGLALTGLAPSATVAGSSDFTLTVTGAGFFSNSVVRWNGSDRPTTFISSTELQAAIPADDIAATGTAQVSVFNPGTGTESGALAFTIAASTLPEGVVQTIIPHSAFGGGFRSRLFLFNLTNNPNTLTINRVAQDGSLLETTEVTLQPAATLMIADSEEARAEPLRVTWYAIGSEGPVGASVLFDFDSEALDLTENFRTSVGALASEPLTAFTLPVRVATAEVTVGLALANLSDSANTIDLKLLNQNGDVVGEDSITLEPFAQTAFSVHERETFQEIVLGMPEFLGALAITTADPGQPVAALVVGNSSGQLFSLPVASGVAQ